MSYYLGRFPKPYGGVTVKNELLYSELSKKIKLDRFDTSILKKKQIWGYISLIYFILKHKNESGFIGVSSKSLIKLIKIINIISIKTLRMLSIFIMGGNIQKIITERDIEILSKTKNIYVESDKIKRDLIKKGFNNVSVIPNCRKTPKNDYKKEFSLKDEHINLIFISNICKEKGVEYLIKVCKVLENKNIKYNFDFYGEIYDNIKIQFEDFINSNNNVRYNGVFKSSKDDIYGLLNKYDILLFPTKYLGEGIPGILIESKIAKLPVIATDWNYNSEIINNKIDGILIKSKDTDIVDDIVENIINLNTNKELLKIMSNNLERSREKYYIEKYIDFIIKNL